MIYLELFFRFFLVSLCSVGGGYAAMPVIQSQVVDGAGWMSAAQFADVVTLSEMTPGPIIINAATFTGHQMAGVPGAVTATMGSISPAIIIVTIISVFFFRNKNTTGIQSVMSVTRPAVAALILSAGISLAITAFTSPSLITESWHLSIDPAAVAAAIIFLIAIRRFRKSPITIIAASAVFGLCFYGILPQIANL